MELEFPPIGCDPVRSSYCCRGLFPGPAELGAVMSEAIVHHYGRDELLRRLANPFWFQSVSYTHLDRREAVFRYAIEDTQHGAMQ